MGFPLDRGSVEDGILTCHWHHARFDLASGCTFDLWADDVPTCPVEVRGGEVWVRVEFGHREPGPYWRQRLHEGMAHNLGLVIAKALQGQLAAGVGPLDIVRQAAVFGARNREGWGTGMTILTALGNLLAILPKERPTWRCSMVSVESRPIVTVLHRADSAQRLPVDLILIRSSGGYGVGRPSVIARQPSEQRLPPSRRALAPRPAIGDVRSGSVKRVAAAVGEGAQAIWPGAVAPPRLLLRSRELNARRMCARQIHP
jgi:hypothetical protein